MSQPISTELRFPFWIMYRATLNILLRSPLQLVFALIFPAAGVFLIWTWVTRHHPFHLYEVAILILAFGFTPIVVAFAMFMARRKNPLIAGPFTYTFDDNGVRVTGALTDSTIKWAAIQRVRKSKNFLFLYIAPTTAISLPIAQLEAAGCYEEVDSMVSARAVQGAQQ